MNWLFPQSIRYVRCENLANEKISLQKKGAGKSIVRSVIQPPPMVGSLGLDLVGPPELPFLSDLPSEPFVLLPLGEGPTRGFPSY